MFFILYLAGKGLKENGGKIFSKPGIAAILAYTLNEGLRFGRGINYSNYWEMYHEVSLGVPQDRDVFFVNLLKAMIFLDIPYQGLIFLESFMFMLGTLFLLRNFRHILPIALPLFTFFSYPAVENMIRWYFGFSFLLIGLSFLLNKQTKYYFVISFIGCLFHIGLVPIVLLFYLFYCLKPPFLHPFISIPLFLAIGLFFQTDMMLELSNYFNLLTSISERAAIYRDNMEMWLTGGYAGIYRRALPSTREMVLLFLMVWCGYKLLEDANHKYIFSYNLFLFGFLIKPIGNQIELLNRYHTVFFFFQAIVLTVILYDLVGKKVLNKLAVNIIIFLLIWNIYGTLKLSYIRPQLHMYVWDQRYENWDKTKERWLDIQAKDAASHEKEDRRK